MKDVRYDAIEKYGIFVVNSEPLEDLMQVAQSERERRMADVLEVIPQA